jgi:hypothetical protein
MSDLRVSVLQALRWISYMFCIICFLVQMVNIGKQFQQEMTMTSISFEKVKTKHLPLLTICAKQTFKNTIYPMTDQQFNENSFNLEDLVTNKSLNEFANTSKWIITTVEGPLVGKCYTFQFREEVQSHNFNSTIYLKRTNDLHVYIHNPGIFEVIFFNIFSVEFNQC